MCPCDFKWIMTYYDLNLHITCAAGVAGVVESWSCYSLSVGAASSECCLASNDCWSCISVYGYSFLNFYLCHFVFSASTFLYSVLAACCVSV